MGHHLKSHKTKSTLYAIAPAPQHQPSKMSTDTLSSPTSLNSPPTSQPTSRRASRAKMSIDLSAIPPLQMPTPHQILSSSPIFKIPPSFAQTISKPSESLSTPQRQSTHGPLSNPSGASSSPSSTKHPRSVSARYSTVKPLL